MVKLFVFIDTGMEVETAIRVFTTRDKAEAYRRTHLSGRPNAYVAELGVAGSGTDVPRVVYVAERYVPRNDVHGFAGLFADWDAAKQSAGPRGHALSKDVDPAE